MPRPYAPMDAAPTSRARLRLTTVCAAAVLCTAVAASPAQAAPLVNGDFELGGFGWSQRSSDPAHQVIDSRPAIPAHSGYRKAVLGGHASGGRDSLSRTVRIPANRPTQLSFWLRIDHAEGEGFGWRELTVEATTESGATHVLATRTNKDSEGRYTRVTVRLPYDFVNTARETTAKLTFTAEEDTRNRFPFLIDDVEVTHNLYFLH